MTSKLASTIRAAVVPPLCVCCLEPELSGAALCGGCRGRLRLVGDPRCGRCGAPGSGECRECRGRALGFDRAWAAFRYEGAARDLVHALKARSLTAAGREMAVALAARAPSYMFDSRVLVPVPAHPSRSRREGFNQAAELVRALARIRRLERADVLLRLGNRRQVGLERRARIENAKRSVTARPAAAQFGPVTLVDDVYTTGATLDACAVALRDAGVGRIDALTFARAVR